MLYIIIAYDYPNTLEKRKTHRPAHLARLNALKQEGRLIIAGPIPSIDCSDPGPAGYSGSMIVAEFIDLESAQSWANDDPFLHEKVYKTVEVFPFVQTLP